MTLDSLRNPRIQMAIAIALLAFSGSYLWWRLRYEPRVLEINVLTTRASTLATTNKIGRQAVTDDGLAKVRERVLAYQRQAAAIERLLPMDTARGSILPLVNETAKQYEVTLTRLSPANRMPGPAYDKETYDATVRGRWNDIGAFLAALGSLDRIVQVKTVKGAVLKPKESDLDPANGRAMSLDFTLVSYLQPTAKADTAPATRSKAPAGAPKVTFKRDRDGKIWEMISVPGKGAPIRLPVPAAARAQAEAAVMKGGLAK